jgi:hypothetical protein
LQQRRPWQKKDGSATVLWMFEAGALTRLGVVEVGGGLLKINFNKTATTGLTCTASVTPAREVGAGNRIDKSPAGGKVETLSARPVGTLTCRVASLIFGCLWRRSVREPPPPVFEFTSHIRFFPRDGLPSPTAPLYGDGLSPQCLNGVPLAHLWDASSFVGQRNAVT